MFGISTGEILIILLIAFLIIPPKQLPKLAKYVGFWIKKSQLFLKKTRAEFQATINAKKNDPPDHGNSPP